MDHTILNDTLFMHLAETDLLNAALKNSWNHIKQYEANLFLAGFRYLKTLCGVGGGLAWTEGASLSCFYKRPAYLGRG